MSVTREELHEMVDRVPADDLDRVAAVLAQLSPTRRRMPRSLGLGRGGSDAASNVDQILREGFGS